MNTPKPQLHVSMLNTLSRCGIAFQRRYGYRFGVWHQEEIIPPAVAMAVGTATHKSVEDNLRHVIETGEMLSVEAVADVARDSFLSVRERQGLQFNGQEALNVEQTVGAAVDLSVELSRLHRVERAPAIIPVDVERRFIVELPDYPIDLAGQIDIVEADAIEDTKTTGRSKGQWAAKTLQMAMYATAYKAASDPDPEQRRFPSMVRVTELLKHKVPKVNVDEHVPTNEWVQPLYNRIERFLELIEAAKTGKAAFTPATPDDWTCTRKWCGYADTCPYFSGRD